MLTFIEWLPVRDANNHLLFEINVLDGTVRTRRAGLTTIINVEEMRRKSLQSQLVGAASPSIAREDAVLIDTRVTSP